MKHNSVDQNQPTKNKSINLNLKKMENTKSKAGDIQYKLATAFSADGIKHYGQLMKELMLDESAVLELYRKKIENIEHRNEVNLDIYSTYRIHVPVMDGDTAAAYFERLCAHYEKNTEEQKEQFSAELEAKKIDLEELISGNSELIKNKKADCWQMDSYGHVYR